VSKRLHTLSNGQFDATTLWKRDPRFISLTDDEYVTLSSSERIVCSVFDMNDIISSMMSFTMSDDTDSTNVVSSRDHSNIPDIKFNVSGDFAGLKIKSNGITDLDSRIRITNGPRVMRDEKRYTALPKLNPFNLAEFIFRFFGGDAVDGETTFDIVYETEILGCLVNGDDVLEAGWEVGICSDFSVDFDETLLEDGGDFTFVQSILETVPDVSVELGIG